MFPRRAASGSNNNNNNKKNTTTTTNNNIIIIISNTASSAFSATATVAVGVPRQCLLFERPPPLPRGGGGRGGSSNTGGTTISTISGNINSNCNNNLNLNNSSSIDNNNINLNSSSSSSPLLRWWCGCDQCRQSLLRSSSLLGCVLARSGSLMHNFTVVLLLVLLVVSVCAVPGVYCGRPMDNEDAASSGSANGRGGGGSGGGVGGRGGGGGGGGGGDDDVGGLGSEKSQRSVGVMTLAEAGGTRHPLGARGGSPGPGSTPRSRHLDGFRLATVDEELLRCMRSGDDILLDSYLAAFREVSKIFKEMGAMFSFVTSDLEGKIQILEEYRARNDVAEHFNSLSSMMSFETASGAIAIRHPPSGCRTWLRLHRALQFVAMFFSRLATVNFQDKMTSLAQDCYEQTLAKYHGYLTRKGAFLAMYALPTVEAMFSKARDEKADVRRLLHSVGMNAARVYDLTQKMFEARGLLNLP